MRDSASGSRASAGRYSLRMIDGGTFQVGLTVMYFIVSVSSGVACSPGLPTTILVVHTVLPFLDDLQRVVGDIDHHVGRAEIVRHPAPALHVGDDGVGAEPFGLLSAVLSSWCFLDLLLLSFTGAFASGSFLISAVLPLRAAASCAFSALYCGDCGL